MRADIADVHAPSAPSISAQTAETSTAGSSTAPDIAGPSTAPDIAPVHGCDEDPDFSPWRPSGLQRRRSRSRRVGRGRSAFSLLSMGGGSEDPDDPWRL